MGLKLNVCAVKCHTVTDVFVPGPAPQSPAVMFNLNAIGQQRLSDKMAGGEGFGSLHPYTPDSSLTEDSHKDQMPYHASVSSFVTDSVFQQRPSWEKQPCLALSASFLRLAL